MTSSPSTLPQHSHEVDEGQCAGRKTSRPPGPKKAPSRGSDAEQQVVAWYVDHDTACDDAQPGRTAEPRVMFEQPGGLICDSMMPLTILMNTEQYCPIRVRWCRSVSQRKYFIQFKLSVIP